MIPEKIYVLPDGTWGQEETPGAEIFYKKGVKGLTLYGYKYQKGKKAESTSRWFPNHNGIEEYKNELMAQGFSKFQIVTTFKK